MNILLEDEETGAIAGHATGRLPVSTWVAGLWTAAVSAWVVVSFVQLRIAAALIELAGLNRGFPISDNDHFSRLPELEAAFDSSNLSFQHPFFWVIVMTAFALSGALVAIAVFRSKVSYSGRMVAMMATIWSLGVIVAMAHGETLGLVMWLTN